MSNALNQLAAMNRSAFLAAAHKQTRYVRQYDKANTYAADFATCLRRQYNLLRAEKAETARKAAMAAEPQVLVTIALTYQMSRERAAAKKEGFTYDGATQTWSKLTKRSLVSASLLVYAVEGATTRPAQERAPYGATRAQRRHFEAEQGIFGAAVSWGDCFPA